MTNIEQTNSSSDIINIIIGTPFAMKFYNCKQDDPINCITTCQKNGTEANIQLQPGISSKSGCEYPFVDPLENSTYFARDNSYGDSEVFRTYNSTSAMSRDFNQKFSNTLRGNEWAAACTAFYYNEVGYQFCIVTHSKEVGLTKFCETNNWNYKILDN